MAQLNKICALFFLVLASTVVSADDVDVTGLADVMTVDDVMATTAFDDVMATDDGMMTTTAVDDGMMTTTDDDGNPMIMMARGGAKPTPSPALPKKIFRFLSIGQYKPTTNMTWAMELEKAIYDECKASIYKGIMFNNANLSVNNMWGSLAKVYDFPSVADFKKYQDCSDNSAKKSILAPWQLEKIHNMGKIHKDAAGVLNSSPYAHVSGGNYTNVSSAISLRTLLFSHFNGMSRGSFVQRDTGDVKKMYPTKSVVNVAQGLGLINIEAGPAYYFYKKGVSAPITAGRTVPPLHQYVDIQKLQTSPSLEIEGMPHVLKA